jgi:hypothetical protein
MAPKTDRLDTQEQVKEAAAFIKQKSESYSLAGAMAQERGFHVNPEQLEVVNTDGTQAEAYDFQQQAEKAAKAIEAYNAAKAARDQSQYLFYQACLSGGHHTIYFARDPFAGKGPIGDGEWWTSYHRLDSKDKFRNPLVCQKCFERGTSRELEVKWVDRNRGIFEPHPTYTFKLAKDPKRAGIEGPIRIATLPHGACNMHAAAREKRVREAVEKGILPAEVLL